MGESIGIGLPAVLRYISAPEDPPMDRLTLPADKVSSAARDVVAGFHRAEGKLPR